MHRDIDIMETEVCELFAREYGRSPEKIVTSPGRVNIIGEHTDYNGGLVLPMAIDRFLKLAVAKRDDDLVRVVTTNFREAIEFSLSALVKGAFTWGEYITGSLWVLQQDGVSLSGFDLAITGNIPVGASLSSSAALELGVLRAAASCAGLEWRPLDMAKRAQRAENEWVGMNCGLMDQAICACGEADRAVLIDFRDLSLKPCPMPNKSSIIVLDTTTRRGLIDSAYNERRQQCDRAAAVMNVATLREADHTLLVRYKEQLEPLDYLRARHVIGENRRVLEAVVAMTGNDDARLGELMYQSHCSLRDDFGVSARPLNTMVECAMEHGACFGARMTGAGFAGCAVALVEAGREKEFGGDVGRKYSRLMDVEPRIYICRASEGTSMKPIGDG